MRSMLLLLTLLVLGCSNPPSSLHPLATNPTSDLPVNLVGSWLVTSTHSKSNGSPAVSIRKAKGIEATIEPKGDDRFTVTLRRDDNECTLDCAFVEINGLWYVDLQQPPLRDADLAGTTLRPHFFFQTIFADGAIRFITPDRDKLKAILETSGLPFALVDDAIVFSGTSDQLQRVISDCGDVLFLPHDKDLFLTPAGGRESNTPAAAG